MPIDTRSYEKSWIPNTIAAEISSCELMLMMRLGATDKDIAARMPPIVGVTVEQLRRRIRKKVDDWREKFCGYMFVRNVHATHKEVVGKLATTIFTGSNHGQKLRRSKFDRPALTELQIYHNCLWDIDAKRGVMVQPGWTAAEAGTQPNDIEHKLFERIPIPYEVQDVLNELKIPLPDEQVMKIRYPDLHAVKDVRHGDFGSTGNYLMSDNALSIGDSPMNGGSLMNSDSSVSGDSPMDGDFPTNGIAWSDYSDSLEQTRRASQHFEM